MKGEPERTYVSISFQSLTRSEADRVVKAALGAAPSLASFNVHYSEAILPSDLWVDDDNWPTTMPGTPA